jgi:hypothetical protein
MHPFHIVVVAVDGGDPPSMLCPSPEIGYRR